MLIMSPDSMSSYLLHPKQSERRNVSLCLSVSGQFRQELTVLSELSQQMCAYVGMNSIYSSS